MGNRFRIVLRDVCCDGGEVEANLKCVRRNGVPNYFGPQRFGSDKKNVMAGFRWIREGRPQIPRFTRSIFISSLRSFLFNEVLGARVRNGTWRTVLDGEAIDDGMTTGPLWGRGRLRSKERAMEIEVEALRDHVGITEALEFVGLTQERRRLSAGSRDIEWSMQRGVLTVEFSLEKGTYATSVLREIGDFREA